MLSSSPDAHDVKVRRRVTIGAAAFALMGSVGSGLLELARSNASAAWMAAGLAAGFAVILYLALRTEHPKLAANALVFLLVSHCSVAVVAHGGGHPSLLVAAVVPVVSILLCGFTAGVLWSLGLFALLLAGAFGAFAPAGDPGVAAWVTGAAILNIATLALAATYEQLRLRARHDANVAREAAAASQRTLERSHERFRALVERTFDGFTILGPEGSLEYLNPAASEATGYEGNAILGITVNDCTTRFVHPEDVERVREAYLRCRAAPGRVVSVEARYRHQELGYKFYELTAKNLIDDPAVRGVVVNYRDLGDRRSAEEGRRQLDARLERARQLESLACLGGGIAHDFNNLFTVVKGNVSLIRRALPEEAIERPSLEEIDVAVDRATQLTDRILAFSGTKSVRRDPIDLGELLSERAEALRASAPAGVELAVEAPSGLNALADASQLRDLIGELFANASEALGERGGTVTLSAGEMRADRSYLEECRNGGMEEGTYAFLEVADLGPGIPAAEVDRIFEPFRSTHFQGRGLGLSVVLGIARSSGAAVHLDTEVGRGTAVRVLFPIATPVAAVAPITRVRAPDAGVLVVDDEAPLRTVVGRLVEDLGLEAITADGAAQALCELERRSGEIALVLLDLTMPEVGGLELVSEIRRLEPDVPIVLMSGYRGTGVEPTDVGVSFLQKPFSRSQLAEALAAAGLPTRH